MAANVELVRAVYPFTGGDQAVPLRFVESTVILVVEKTNGGWCRGFAAGKEGWFPISYVKPLGNIELMQKGIEPSELAAVMHSEQWTAHITNEDKIYYVNTYSQGTTWELPTVSPISPTTSVPPTQPTSSPLENGAPPKTKTHKLKKPKYQMVNGLNFMMNGEEQARLNPSEISYVDHFWADKGDQYGFDVVLEKHLNGKQSMKDMIDFFRERAALEEQYAKGLLKLSKSTLGDQEEGTIGKAWQSLKAELRHRSEAHTKFAEKVPKEMEKPLFDYKESQKKTRKEHQQIMEKSRKQVATMDAIIEKARGNTSSRLSASKLKKVSAGSIDGQAPGKRRQSLTGDEIKKLEENYNQAQRQWVDNMINACQDFEKQEEERSAFLKNHLLKYVDLCVEVDEASAVSLSRVADGIDRINKKADREYFIKLKGTGTARPVDRVLETF